MSCRELILVVDDNEMNRMILEECLSEHYAIASAENGAEALEVIKDVAPALVLMDIMMPEMDGYAACEAIKGSPCGEFTQVVLVSAKASAEERLKGYEVGADDYLVKPFNHDELLAKVRVQLRLRKTLFEVARTRAQIAVQNNSLEAHVAEQEQQLTDTRDLVVYALARLAESRDPETGDHLARMRNYCRILAEHLRHEGPYMDQLDAAFPDAIFQASPLHDIGKVGVPDAILLKPGKLSDEEFAIMQQHCVIGADALREVAAHGTSTGFLDMAIDIAQSHHEKFNGKGYPNGLAGHAIPLSARITAVADVFDALTTKRVYKPAFPLDEARRIILGDAGQHFDPAVAEAFDACFDRFRQTFEDLADPGSSEMPPETPAQEESRAA